MSILEEIREILREFDALHGNTDKATDDIFRLLTEKIEGMKIREVRLSDATYKNYPVEAVKEMEERIVETKNETLDTILALLTK